MNFELIMWYVSPALVIAGGLTVISIIIQLWFNSWGGMLLQKKFPMFMTKKTALKLIALKEDLKKYE